MTLPHAPCTSSIAQASNRRMKGTLFLPDSSSLR